jgi:hypothetical protein
LKEVLKIQAKNIIKEITTDGSSPLLVMGSDNNSYYAKSTSTKIPRLELINELLCAYFVMGWNLQGALFALITIGKDLVDNYVIEQKPLSQRYSNLDFDNELFFASRRILTALEHDIFNNGLTANDIKSHAALDYIKIGVFDNWVGNMDRQPKNPNVVMSFVDNKFVYHPIDHTAAFAYLEYRQIKHSYHLRIDPRNCILSTPLARSILKFENSKKVANLKQDILNGMNNVIENLEFIYSQVPKEWGFSSKAKEHLKKFLSDTQRNETIANIYLSYIKS